MDTQYHAESVVIPIKHKENEENGQNDAAKFRATTYTLPVLCAEAFFAHPRPIFLTNNARKKSELMQFILRRGNKRLFTSQ